MATWLALLASFATAALAATAIWALVLESRRAHLTLSADLALKLEDRFNQAAMLKHRRRAAEALRSGTYPNDDVDSVFDFFETVGFLVSRGAIDAEAVWSMFDFWVEGYSQAARLQIDEVRAHKEPVWRHFAELNDKLRKVDRKQSGTQTSSWGAAEIREFLRGESAL
jgi:hypothetical protein